MAGPILRAPRAGARHPAARVIMPSTEMRLNRDAWLRLRRRGVTSTDARVLAGHGYEGESVFDCWLSKTVDVDTDDAKQPLAVRLGADMEDLIALAAADDLGIKVSRSGMLQNLTAPWLLASPDRNCNCGGHVEIKRTHYGALARAARDSPERNDQGWALPAGWRAQVEHQMDVSGRDHVHVAAYVVDRERITTWLVERDEDRLAANRARAAAFWQLVTDGTPPVPDWETITAAEVAARWPAATVPTRVVVDPGELTELRALAAARAALKAQVKSSEQQLASVENRLRGMAGDAVELHDPDGVRLMKYGSYTQHVWDWRAFTISMLGLDPAQFSNAAGEFVREKFERLYPDLAGALDVTGVTRTVRALNYVIKEASE